MSPNVVRVVLAVELDQFRQPAVLELLADVELVAVAAVDVEVLHAEVLPRGRRRVEHGRFIAVLALRLHRQHVGTLMEKQNESCFQTWNRDP